MPLLNIYATAGSPGAAVGEPPAARARPARRDYTEHEFQGGHIGIYVSGAAQREIPERDRQLAARDRDQ